MTPSEFLHSKLKGIAPTFPLSAKNDAKAPYIIYSIDSIENTKTISGRIAYKENFVTITVYSDEYDKANTLATEVVDALNGSKELNIMGTSFTSKAIERLDEPVDLYSVVLDYSIYER